MSTAAWAQEAGLMPANTVFAGPTSGAEAFGTARALVAGDINGLSPSFAGLTVTGLASAGTSCVQVNSSGVFSITGSACGSSSGAVNSVSNSDGTLTISPTTGVVVASIALGHANTWSATQTFSNVIDSNLVSGGTQCVQASSAGLLSGSGTPCSSSVTSVSNSDGSLTISPTTGAVIGSINVGHTNTWTVNQFINGGSLGIGETSLQSTIFGDTPLIQLSGLAYMDFRRYGNNAFTSYITFTKSRGASVGTNVAVQNGDQVGYISFDGYDATSTPVDTEVALIQANVDNTVTAGAVPGRLSFWTTGVGQNFLTKRVLIDSTGQTTFEPTSTANAQVQINATSTGPWQLKSSMYDGGLPNEFAFENSRGTSIGQMVTSHNADVIAGTWYYGADASGSPLFQIGAYEQVVVEGTPTAGHVAAQYDFHTISLSGTDNVALQLTAGGEVRALASTGAPFSSGSGSLAVQIGTTNFPGIGFQDGGGIGVFSGGSGTILNIAFGTTPSTAVAGIAQFQYSTLSAAANAALNLTPVASSIQTGLLVTQTRHGTNTTTNCSGCFDGIVADNAFSIASDDENVVSPIAGSAVLAIGLKWGGSNTHGERSPLYISSFQTAADSTSSNPFGANNVAATIVAVSNINNGGSNGSPRGGNFALNPKCILQSGATFWGLCLGAEVDMEIDTGASVYDKVGWFIYSGTADKVQGINYDVAFGFSGGTSGGGIGFKCGFCATDIYTGGPLSSSGTVFGTQFLLASTYNASYGVDLRGFIFSQFAFISGNSSNGFAVTQNGDVIGHTYAILQSGTQTNGVTCTAGSVNAATFTSLNGIVTHC